MTHPQVLDAQGAELAVGDQATLAGTDVSVERIVFPSPSLYVPYLLVGGDGFTNYRVYTIREGNTYRCPDLTLTTEKEGAE